MKKIIVIVFVLLLPTASFSMERERLVLMPLKGKGIDQAYFPSMESALIEGLSAKYKVFAGKRVVEKVQEIFQKISQETAVDEECDETKCMQEIGMEFQAELVATSNVLKNSSGYLLTVNIVNVFEDTVVFSKSEPCKGCDEFRVIEVLKAMAANKTLTPSAAQPVARQPTPPSINEEKIRRKELAMERRANLDACIKGCEPSAPKAMQVIGAIGSLGITALMDKSKKDKCIKKCRKKWAP